MLRLLRNNRFFGEKAQKTNDPEISFCYLCCKHIEKRIPLIFRCEIVNYMTQYLIRVLKKAGFLSKGHQIGLFLFKDYNFNSIENLTLTTLWNFIYNLKFSPEKVIGIKFNHYMRNILCQLTVFPPPLLLEA